MPGKQYSENYQIPYFETDIKGELTLASLVNILILASEHQLNALNVGEATMHALNLGWVVTQYQMKITRMPKVDEKVRIVTEAESYNKYFCYRNFWLYDEAGNECVFVQSIFLLIIFRDNGSVERIDVIIRRTEIRENRIKRKSRKDTQNGDKMIMLFPDCRLWSGGRRSRNHFRSFWQSFLN